MAFYKSTLRLDTGQTGEAPANAARRDLPKMSLRRDAAEEHFFAEEHFLPTNLRSTFFCQLMRPDAALLPTFAPRRRLI